MANTAWNPSDKAANVTLSNLNLTATASSGATGLVRAVDKIASGKFYWEYTTGVVTINVTGAGLSTPGLSLTTNPFNTVGACTLYPTNGTLWYDNSSLVFPGSPFANGTVICYAVDYDNHLIWVRIGAAGNWNNSGTANPATGTGGLTFAHMGGVLQPTMPHVVLGASGDKITANFGDSAFAGTVPSGFTSGYTAGLASATYAGVTQVTIEQWSTVANAPGGQALVTQVALEQWVPATKPSIDLAGNLGAPSSYGKLSYGLKHYSRGGPIAPIFAGDLTFAAKVDLAGGLTPIIVLAADLDVHVNLIEFAGDLAPQIALGGSLSLDLPLTALGSGLTPIVSLGASSFVSGPLWADSEPCPSPPWAPSEPCPPPPWMTAAPCDPVVWSKSRLCNG